MSYGKYDASRGLWLIVRRGVAVGLTFVHVHHLAQTFFYKFELKSYNNMVITT